LLQGVKSLGFWILFTSGGNELKNDSGIKSSFFSPVEALAVKICKRAGNGENYGTDGFRFGGSIPKKWALSKVLGAPNPDMEAYVHYSVDKDENCCCQIKMDFTITFNDEFDFHPMRDGKILEVDWFPHTLASLGMGKEFPIAIPFTASGTSKVSPGVVKGKEVFVGSGWPFEE
jgi:hypothetical protein